MEPKLRFDLKAAWTAAIRAGTAVCRGGCGDPPTKLKLNGYRPGTYCAGCFREVAYGTIPKLDHPKSRSKVRRLR